MSDYIPIDCNLYDHYESAATLNRMVELELNDGSIRQGVIVDLFVREKVEWMKMHNGGLIRLDHILSMKVIEEK